MRRSMMGLAVLLVLGSAASAQYSFQPMVTPWDLDTGMMAETINRNLIIEEMTKDAQAENGEADSAVEPGDGAPSAGAVEDADIASLGYTPSAERRRANLAQFVEKTRAAYPAGAQRLEQLFASTDIMAAIAEGLSPYGLSIDNLADAYAVYWMNAWQVAYGDVSEDFTTGQAQAVRRQAANAILAAPRAATMTDAQKQEMAEAMLIQAALVAAAAEEAGNDPQNRAHVADAVKQGAEASSLELDRMVLTPEGFRPREGSATGQ